jgi:hypothetical protein
VNIRIEITQEELKALVYKRISEMLGDIPFNRDDVKIETKSTQNYKSEWEGKAGFRAVIEINR